MARGAGKRGGKQTIPTTSIPAAAAASNDGSNIPQPFSLVSPALRPFTSTLPTSHVYAIHVDKSPVTLKKRVFTVPLCMNLVITAVLAARVYYAAPQYLEQLITIFGYETSWTVKPSGMGPGDLMGTITNRTFLLMIDYFLFGMLGSWPWEFVFGSRYSRHTGAVGWRRELGFKPTEIVVRQGRKWDTLLLEGATPDQKRKAEQQAKIRHTAIDGKGRVWTQQDELTLKVKLDAAMRKTYTSKTGYLLLDKDWDLDFRGMIDVHGLVESGEVKIQDLDHIVLVFYQGQWLMWYPHSSSSVMNTQDLSKDSKLQTFKDKLVKLNCEDVFYRWIEIVQYETSQPGGFNETKRQEAVGELKRLLTARKKDAEKFLQDIGGTDELPGLEAAG